MLPHVVDGSAPASLPTNLPVNVGNNLDERFIPWSASRRRCGNGGANAGRLLRRLNPGTRVNFAVATERDSVELIALHHKLAMQEPGTGSGVWSADV